MSENELNITHFAKTRHTVKAYDSTQKIREIRVDRAGGSRCIENMGCTR